MKYLYLFEVLKDDRLSVTIFRSNIRPDIDKKSEIEEEFMNATGNEGKVLQCYQIGNLLVKFN